MSHSFFVFLVPNGCSSPLDTPLGLKPPFQTWLSLDQFFNDLQIQRIQICTDISCFWKSRKTRSMERSPLKKRSQVLSNLNLITNFLTSLLDSEPEPSHWGRIGS